MPSARILHLEDNEADAFLIRHALECAGIKMDYSSVADAAGYEQAIASREFDLVISDHRVPGFGSLIALRLARQRFPGIPFIGISGSWPSTAIGELMAAGATRCLSKGDDAALVSAVTDALEQTRHRREADRLQIVQSASARLVAAVQQLSLARDFDSIRAIVRRAARDLVGADGATLVLREGNQCHYVDEDAIAPLWKGRRFPLSACISGWTMIHHKPAAIRDIYADPRIPADAYRPTFVKSLVMVPIRPDDPIGAIGNYWASYHDPEPEEIELLQALANTTAVAIENARANEDIERRVRERTLQLESANVDLAAFSYSVSHDLRAPLHNIGTFAELLEEEATTATPEARREYTGHIRRQVGRMTGMIDDFLRLSRVAQSGLDPATIDLAPMGDDIIADLRASAPGRSMDFIRPASLPAIGDPRLVRIVLENLLSNAWKYTGRLPGVARIELGIDPAAHVYFVRDNGAGFDPAHADKLFVPFQRLHSQKEFAGSGIGLATVARIIGKHGGRIWAESFPGEGATFFFTLAPAPA